LRGDAVNDVVQVFDETIKVIDTGDKGSFTRPVHCEYITRKWTKYLGYTSPEHPENYNADRLLALIATGSSALGFDCNSVPLVVRASRSWGLILMWVLDIVILSFES